ncbi:unnamed protein product [Calicophoron daubneyi]|uniref:Uncharacterized protein n=1 Tax=Calicophoron daubneyi TaxID=300641 RepID=A0AAV2TPF7_CALDB
MEALKQENYELSQKLKLARCKESTYLEEIEHLKESLAAISVESRTTERPNNDRTFVEQAQERAELAEENVAKLTEELKAAKRTQLELQERLNFFESRFEASASESSVCSAEPSGPDRTALLDELSRLKEDMSMAEAESRMMRSKFERQLSESEADRIHLEQYANELNHQLQEARSEACDLRAQIDALELQANAVDNKRGNSVFSEIEDRRIRAENLVIQQRKIIEELRLQINKVEADAQRKAIEIEQKWKTWFRERDTNFTDELIAERSRLVSENSQLSRRIEQLEELQLDNERGAAKMSKAFNLEGNCQDNLVKLLERRVASLQRRLNERAAMIDSLRERLVKSGLQRRDIQNELLHQKDLCDKLTVQLNKTRNEAHLSPNNSQGILPRNQPHLSDTVTNENHPPLSLTDELAQAVNETKSPSVTSKGREFGSATQPTRPSEMPPGCKTS